VSRTGQNIMAKFGNYSHLLMLRTRGRSGPMFQNIGNGVFAHSSGAAYSIGGPLSGAKAVRGVADSETSINIFFTQCVDITGTAGIQYSINGGAWTGVTLPTGSGTTWSFTVGAIAAGDEVRWRYIAGSNTIVDCEESQDIGAQEIPILNPLVLQADVVLISTGGSDVLLLTDYAVDTDAVALSDA